jgi:hypothetical protein
MRGRRIIVSTRGLPLLELELGFKESKPFAIARFYRQFGGLFGFASSVASSEIGHNTTALRERH